MASAQIAKRSETVSTGFALHRHEFMNYYDPPRALFEAEPYPLRATVAPGIELGVEAVIDVDGPLRRDATVRAAVGLGTVHLFVAWGGAGPASG